MIMRARVFSGMFKREASFVKPISLPDSDASHFTLHERCRVVLFIAFALAGLLACERTPDQAPSAKNPVVTDKPGVLRLTAKELSRTAIELAPVARGQLLVPREFPATVQANENELAEVTTLIRAGW
jgi:hypothetical protein